MQIFQQGAILSLLALGTAGAVPAAAPDDAPRQRPPNVLLVTVDTLRPDALGWVGGGEATPEIDALAAEGFRFAKAVSPVPLTLPAHASLLTGVVPRRHGVRDNGQVVGEAPRTLAEALSAAGWTTAAVVSGFPLAAGFGLDRGFSHYDDRFSSGAADRLERPAEETTAAALGWLAGAPEPWFLWVHYYDPHDPYEPPARHRRAGPRGAYDGEVAFVDESFGTLRRGIAGRLSGPLLTVLTADHGESLGEHGENTHGFFVYDSTVTVPLVFHLPGRIASGESPASARLVDVAPTVLDLLGLDPLGGRGGGASGDLDGVSLVPTLGGESQQIPAAHVESRRPWISYGWAPLAAVRHDGWKLIAAPRPELYDLAADPGELRNRVDTDRPVARWLEAILRQAEARPAAASAARGDSETAARLRALGYAGAGAADPGEPPRDAADPKDRIALWNDLGAAEEALARGDEKAALARFDAVLKAEPKNRYALGRSAVALLESGQPAAAASRLESAVALDPDRADTRESLALAYTRLSRYAEAVEQWLELARLQPRRPAVWANLGNGFGLAGDPKKAVGALQRAVELAPEEPALSVRLAFAHNAAGDVPAAVALLREVAEATGASFPHSAALGLLLLAEGKPEQARPWLGRSRPGEADHAAARFELARLEARAGNADAARKALGEALAAAPALRARASADPLLLPLLP